MVSFPECSINGSNIMQDMETGFLYLESYMWGLFQNVREWIKPFASYGDRLFPLRVTHVMSFLECSMSESLRMHGVEAEFLHSESHTWGLFQNVLWMDHTECMVLRLSSYTQSHTREDFSRTFCDWIIQNAWCWGWGWVLALRCTHLGLSRAVPCMCT